MHLTTCTETHLARTSAPHDLHRDAPRSNKCTSRLAPRRTSLRQAAPTTCTETHLGFNRPCGKPDWFGPASRRAPHDQKGFGPASRRAPHDQKGLEPASRRAPHDQKGVCTGIAPCTPRPKGVWTGIAPQLARLDSTRPGMKPSRSVPVATCLASPGVPTSAPARPRQPRLRRLCLQQ